jgi:hypothetical protein
MEWMHKPIKEWSELFGGLPHFRLCSQIQLDAGILSLPMTSVGSLPAPKIVNTLCEPLLYRLITY